MTTTAGHRAGPVPRPDLAGLPAYSSVASGERSIRVRASSNEAPWPAPAELVTALQPVLRDAARYPALGGEDLITAVSVHWSLPSSCVAVADGSLPLLDRLLLAFTEPGDEVVHAWRSYEAYPLSIRVTRGRSVAVPLDGAGRHDLRAMRAAIGPRTRVVLLCNPNNPTGTALSWRRIEDFLDVVPPHMLVVLDEAYAEFADPALVPPDAALTAAASRRANLAVLRTFSKAHGLAGLRAGYLVGPPDVVAAVRRVLPPFPLSAVAAAAAAWGLERPGRLGQAVEAVRHEREALTELLGESGMPHLPSQANFVWLPLGDRALEFADACLAHGVSVRPFDGEGVRITVGHPALSAALHPVLRSWRRA